METVMELQKQKTNVVPLPLPKVQGVTTKPKPGEKLADVVLLKPEYRFDLFFGSVTGVVW